MVKTTDNNTTAKIGLVAPNRDNLPYKWKKFWSCQLYCMQRADFNIRKDFQQIYSIKYFGLCLRRLAYMDQNTSLVDDIYRDIAAFGGWLGICCMLLIKSSDAMVDWL